MRFPRSPLCCGSPEGLTLAGMQVGLSIF